MVASSIGSSKSSNGKYICYSVYGNNSLYTLGAIENAHIINEIFPDWKARFYCYKNVDQTVIDTLKRLGAEVVIIYEKYRNIAETIAKCTFWRYYALADPAVKICMFRDADSRIGYKEKYAVDQWLKCGQDFHLLYDHPQHTIEILGGMWGVKADILRNIKTLIRQYFNNNDVHYRYDRTYDQRFLKHKIFPLYLGCRAVPQHTYLAHGNLGECEYHRNAGIKITPYPRLPDSVPPFPNPVCGLNMPTFIGETVLTPYWQLKVPRFTNHQINQNSDEK